MPVKRKIHSSRVRFCSQRAAVAAGCMVSVLAFSAGLPAQEPAYEFTTVAGTGGVPLNVVTVGNRAGRSIVFAHGIGQSYLAFENQLRSSLQKDFQLVAFDLRGHGNSGKPWTQEAYSERAVWAGDLDRVVRALGLRRPVLVGWSYGTLVVLDYVRMHGTDNVSGIVLTGSYGGLARPDVQRSPPPPDPEFIRLRDDMASADLDRKWTAAHEMARYLTARPMPADWIERAAAVSLLLPQSARAGMYLHPFDNADLVPSLKSMPMLLVIGGQDASAQETDGLQLIKRLPRARLAMYPAEGHSVFIESPEKFNRELRDFAMSFR
jgi:non-heme chloroperoxidase